MLVSISLRIYPKLEVVKERIKLRTSNLVQQIKLRECRPKRNKLELL